MDIAFTRRSRRVLADVQVQPGYTPEQVVLLLVDGKAVVHDARAIRLVPKDGGETGSIIATHDGMNSTSQPDTDVEFELVQDTVAQGGECPDCGMADIDHLVWDDDGEEVTCQRCYRHYTPGGDNDPKTPTEAARAEALDQLTGAEKVKLPEAAVVAGLIADQVHIAVRTRKFLGGGVGTHRIVEDVKKSLACAGIRTAAFRATEAYLGFGKLPGTVVQAAIARAEGGAS